MPTLDESLSVGPAQLKADLLAALRETSGDQYVTFTQYIRKVLPLDGYVFWLKTKDMTVPGSLHYTTDKRQNEDETIAVNRVIFTTGEEVQAFNEIAANVIWVGEFNGVKFAFSSRQNYYRNADLHHYIGDAVYPAMYSQLVDLGSQLSDKELVVTNSLPAWLTIPSYDPVWMGIANPGILLYPSFAVPDNLRPPYGVVHVEPSATQALQSAPKIGKTYTHAQLAQDKVRITAYGWTNSNALDFLDVVNQYSVDQDVIGVMNVPTWRDEKRTQAELGVLAMKKTIEFVVSYNQLRVNNIARQLILHARATFVPYPGA